MNLVGVPCTGEPLLGNPQISGRSIGSIQLVPTKDSGLLYRLDSAVLGKLSCLLTVPSPDHLSLMVGTCHQFVESVSREGRREWDCETFQAERVFEIRTHRGPPRLSLSLFS